jgi:hypothetical protein
MSLTTSTTRAPHDGTENRVACSRTDRTILYPLLGNEVLSHPCAPGSSPGRSFAALGLQSIIHRGTQTAARARDCARESARGQVHAFESTDHSTLIPAALQPSQQPPTHSPTHPPIPSNPTQLLFPRSYYSSRTLCPSLHPPPSSLPSLLLLPQSCPLLHPVPAHRTVPPPAAPQSLRARARAYPHAPRRGRTSSTRWACCARAAPWWCTM